MSITALTRTGIALVALLFVLMWVVPVDAYPRYYNDSQTAGSNCSACHGAFTSGISPGGNAIPSSNKHEMHRAAGNMNADCDLCHTNNDGRNPFTNSSNGASGIGYGCTGCHGRLEDGGNDAISTGYGAGLRQHHWNVGIQTCGTAGCHTDANPANYTPVGENVNPPYYGVTADSKVAMPCNPVAMMNVNENWTFGDFEGMDNDGDNIYDGADPDCNPATQGPGEAGRQGLVNPLLVTAKNTVTGTLNLTIGVPCGAADMNLHFGPLSQVSSYTYSGEDCSMDNSGSHTWAYGSGSLYFLVVAADGTTAGSIEGSYGDPSPGGPPERGENPNNGNCNVTRDVSNACDN